jgi:hypothetical protein
MRLKVWDRVFGALSGLMILVAGVGLFVFGAGIFPFRLDVSFLDRAYAVWQRAVMVTVAVGLCLLGIRGILMLFRGNRERGFIMQHTEYGDLSISMTAMENMVKKCVDTHEELKVSSTRILHARDGVIVSMRISLAGGVNIPLAVSALQKQIKQYITSCSGVDVREVRVMVETNSTLAPFTGNGLQNGMMADVDAAARAVEVVGSLHEAAQNATQAEPEERKKPEKVPLHQRLFRREEKPQIVPAPPEVPAEEAEVPAMTAFTPREPEPPEAEKNHDEPEIGEEDA